MTPEERQLITGLFDRMRGFALTGRDGEAEALIKEQVATLPDAPYMLVQSVLVQEQALQQADSRIKALEEQVRTLQEAQQQRPGGGSFLGGGLFGSRATPEADREPGRGASVPTIGSRATPSVYGSQSAWGAPQAGAPTAPPPESTGGSFLRSAMATATGVAGGMLAASAISSLFGGHARAGTPTATATTAPQQTQATAPDTTSGGATETGHAGEPQHEQHEGYHEAAYEDDDGWFGGGSDDFEI